MNLEQTLTGMVKVNVEQNSTTAAHFEDKSGSIVEKLVSLLTYI